jgi:radical SAM protein with 4Fe4S-binding SPASM domain
MANLSITNKCNKKCVYCFAGDTLDEYGQTYMETSVYLQALDYLKRSDLKEVRLLGGEPSLHPGFIDFVKIALDKGFRIMLFSNGLINNVVLSFLEGVPASKLSVLLNSIHPNENNQQGIERQKKTMKALREKIIVGVNIFSDNQDLLYLLDYVPEFNLKTEIRLGISHSVLSQNNVYLHPKEYRRIGKKIAFFKMEAVKLGISFGFDCGFVPCMFPEEHLDLLREELQKAGTCCHPIIDLLTDGTFISCYPLNNLQKVKINDSIVLADLADRFGQALKPFKQAGIYPHCSSCPLFNNRCNGGCMSFRIQRFENR